ncbi:MAG: polymerase subunit sigma-70 [Marmoricola sp.]|jgi:RNA polymerase sigma factor (sigma-70 family)|nr:polymerase subunit sigma-70 [Marmoricola sp.]
MSELPTESPSLWETAASHFDRWRAGENAALDDLVRLLSPMLWQVVRASGLDHTTAEDVVQTTWLTLVRSGESISESRAVAGWLCTTARREAWRVAKQSTRQRPVEDETIARRLPDEPAPEGQVVLDDDNARLWGCLSRLSERCQKLLRIVAAESRPDYTVIAASLGMPVGSIGPTRGRCLDKLRQELVQAGGR